MRRVGCPACKTAAGRACHTAGSRPTKEHHARRDAVGPIPYAKERKEGLVPEQQTYTIRAGLKGTEKARADFSVGTALANGVAAVRMFPLTGSGWDGVGLSLYRVVRELRTLRAAWTAACPACHRDIPDPAPP
ncbi:zinc finger domain-containing protein [Streptomyces sp. DT224]|uniref:zinc finger domain-containing protein n=1 Tax=Streptomyces sp. DT224 TaxID=3393426 RepID=UPI003CEBF3B0